MNGLWVPAARCMALKSTINAKPPTANRAMPDWANAGVVASRRLSQGRTGVAPMTPATSISCLSIVKYMSMWWLIPVPVPRGGHTYYSVDLPSEAPVVVQAAQLRDMLDAIYRSHAGEPVYVVGHSAGGVVARAALVNNGGGNTRALITIASPHLGTYRAEQALDATDIPFPFSILPDIFAGEIYDTARRSRSLYVDLVRPRPGTLLYWLNGQPHPDILYFSIVRGQVSVAMGDLVVPGYSQDMNNIPVLRGRSTRISIPSDHGLDVLDGGVIVNLLSELG